MKKLIIVNWRWEKLYEKNKSHSKIDINEKHKIVYSRQADEDDFNSLLKSLLSEFVKDDECLILTHFNETSQKISIPEESVSLPQEFKGKSKIREFSGGRDKVYYGANNTGGLFDPGDETIKKENFDFIWDYYWNQLELDYQKKKIINTFLPLIIDIKGLDELTDDPNRRKEYLKEIHQAIGKQKPEPITNSEKKATSAENEDTLYGYGIDLISDWNEIKKFLAIKVDENSKVDEVLSEKYRITDKASLYFSPLESEKKPGFIVDNIKELFDDSNKDKRDKAIQWFYDIQKLLNEQIKPERESGTSKS